MAAPNDTDFAWTPDYINALNLAFGSNAWSSSILSASSGIVTDTGRQMVAFVNNEFMRRTTAASLSEFSFGFKTKVVAFGGGGTLAGVQNASFTNPLHFDVNGSGLIRLMRQATPLATLITLMPTGTPITIELTAKIHATTGNFRVYVNGVLEGEDNNIDTEGTGTGGVPHFFINGLNTGFTHGTRFCDIYYIARTGITDVLGPGRVWIPMPTAEGSIIEWTPSTGSNNAATIDEVPADGADYNETSTIPHTDEFEVQDMATLGAIGTPRLYVPWGMTWLPGGGSTKLELGLVSGATTDYSAARAISSSSYGTVCGKGYRSDPDGDIAWTEAAIAALKQRYRSAA